MGPKAKVKSRSLFALAASLKLFLCVIIQVDGSEKVQARLDTLKVKATADEFVLSVVREINAATTLTIDPTGVYIVAILFRVFYKCTALEGILDTKNNSVFYFGMVSVDSRLFPWL